LRTTDKPLDTPVDDEELVLRMMEKDESALLTLLEAYGPKVKGYLKKHFGDVLKAPELEDAFSKAAFNVWRFAERFKPECGSLRGWFLKIARNAAISVLRAESRHMAKALEYDPLYDPADDYPDESPDIDSKEHHRLRELDNILYNILTGLEQIVALNDFKAGGEANTGRLAAMHGKTRQNIYTTRSKVKKKIVQMMLESESRHEDRKVKP
jgi:RNA polymerase sigma factor (sigma-70 family)